MRVAVFPMWFLLSSTIGIVEPIRRDINEMMFVNIPSGSACFRRLNGTHQFGCSSALRGASGVIQVVHDETAVETFLTTAVAGPYVVLMPPVLFNRGVVDRLVDSGKVSGVVLSLDPKSQIPSHYSPDSVCPNGNEGCDVSNPWNPRGNSFLLKDWPFPVFLIQDEVHLQNITDCFTNFNIPVDETQLNRPLCMLQLKSHMFGAVSSEVCMRRITQQFMGIMKYCDPLGNENIVHPMIDWNDSVGKKSILVIARLDGVSLFDGIAPGAMSAVSGAAGLMVLASIMKRLLPNLTSPLFGLMLMLLNGETFDYIGSQRIVYDMEHGNFFAPSNTTLSNVAFIVELSQIGPGSDFVIHATDDITASAFAKTLISLSKNSTVTFKTSKSTNLPPVSLNTFVKADRKIPGVVITNYDQSFTNQYYNGLFDNSTNMNYIYTPNVHNSSTQNNIAVGVDVLARALANVMSDAFFETNISETLQTTNEVLHCYLVTRKCKLFQKVYPIIATNVKGPEGLSFYVGISTSISHVTRATWKVLAYLSARSELMPREKCDAACSTNDNLKCLWFKDDADSNGTCVFSPIKLLPSVSPAFEIEGYDWKSGEYSTWTESVWSEIGVRMYVQGTAQKDVVVFSSGLVLFIFSFVSVYVISNKCDSLFAPKLPVDSC